MAYAGIDYGLGKTNIDKSNRIRYGVIHSGELEIWWEASEPDYGQPSCPKCGNAAVEYDDDKHGDYPQHTTRYRSCADYACESCKIYFDSDHALPDSPIRHTLDDGEYKATQDGNDCDVFVLKSPYYTHAQFCSPCAPGACYLLSPVEDGPKAYCFGHDWFESGVAPYPVFRVSDDSPVKAEN